MSAENQRSLAVKLGLVPATVEPTAEPEQEPDTPDFDGGVREPVPGPSDPEAEHGEFLTNLLRNTPTTGGGQW